jgi:hypothetical protein
MKRRDYSAFLLSAYLLGLPVWWALGIDFLMPMLLGSALMYSSLKAHRRFTASDYVLAAIIIVLIGSAYLNGFLLAGETMRFAAALYNASIWACGLILLQQVRYTLDQTDADRQAVLRAGFWGFMLLSGVAWGSFVFAYAIGRFSLELPSLFGLIVGQAVPDSAVLIKQSTILVFARPDWGLPGVPMPRIVIYGPYPNATAAITAVLGTLALLYLCVRNRYHGVLIAAGEALIFFTLVITLSRSILAGWLVGSVAANLVFGTAYRRVVCSFALGVAALLAMHANVSNLGEYREYSTESRVNNYVRAIEKTILTHPVLGLGIKPREEGNHIAVGSHSTFVSSLTKGGALGVSLVFIYLVVLPAFRWIALGATQPLRSSRAEMRILFTLQVTIWAWLCFEDIDAPATAAMLIFLAFGFFESIFRSAQISRQRHYPGAARVAASSVT